jgi:hypothetical protein
MARDHLVSNDAIQPQRPENDIRKASFFPTKIEDIRSLNEDFISSASAHILLGISENSNYLSLSRADLAKEPLGAYNLIVGRGRKACHVLS